MTRIMGARLSLSSRRGGEVIRLNEFGSRRPLKDLLREAGVPPWWRNALPLLYVDDELVWIAGVGSSIEYRCKPDAEGILIEFDGVSW